MPRRNFILICLIWAISVACCYQTDRFSRLLLFAMRQIGQRHVEKVDPKDLFEGAMQGMSQCLAKQYADPYTNYIPPDVAKRFQEELDQEFAGLGMEVALSEETNRLTVVSPLFDSPAYKAGILAGDEILKINNKNTEGMILEDTIGLMRGPVGQPVHLSILHQGDDTPVEMDIVREIIKVDTVLGDTRNADGSWNYFLDGEDRIGYLRVNSISENTDRQLREALGWLVAHDMRGLILDLRNNLGGYVDKAVTICDMFIDNGRIVSTKNRSGATTEVYSATSEGTYPNFPMAVIVNQNSASAAEIIAACLQDHHRAAIVGQRSYGKGTVQEVLYLDTEGGVEYGTLKITSASYWRPSGHNINRGKDKDEWGVSPDKGLEVIVKDEDFKKLLLARYERDTFKNPGENGTKEKPTPDDPKKEPEITEKEKSPTKESRPGQDPAKARNTPSPPTAEQPADEPFFDPQLDVAVEHIKSLSEKSPLPPGEG